MEEVDWYRRLTKGLISNENRYLFLPIRALYKGLNVKKREKLHIGKYHCQKYTHGKVCCFQNLRCRNFAR